MIFYFFLSEINLGVKSNERVGPEAWRATIIFYYKEIKDIIKIYETI